MEKWQVANLSSNWEKRPSEAGSGGIGSNTSKETGMGTLGKPLFPFQFCRFSPLYYGKNALLWEDPPKNCHFKNEKGLQQLPSGLE